MTTNEEKSARKDYAMLFDYAFSLGSAFLWAVLSCVPTLLESGEFLLSKAASESLKGAAAGAATGWYAQKEGVGRKRLS